MRKAFQILLTSFSAAVTAAPALAADDVMVVFDGSNSMWGQIDGTAKIEIARDVIGNLTAELEPTANVGLMAYGHRRRGDCSDIEVVLPPAPLDRSTFLDEIAKITPTGKTPLTDAVAQAAETLSFRDRPATVVLISDGVESCQRDPCALAGDLERRGVDFTAHVVGFGLGANEDTRSLACIADQTGGQYIAAADAAELGAALSTVGAAVAQSAPAPEPEPEPEPQFTLTAPESVTQGAAFEFSWNPAGDNPRDYVTIVPMGAEDGTYESYIRVQDDTAGSLVAPAETGLYDLRYMLKDTGTTAGSTPVEVVPAEVTVSGPETAVTGASFDVTWTGAVHPRDYVTIVPMGTEDGKYASYFRVGDHQKDSLVAPAEPGLYELRYMLKEGAKVMARAPIEVTEPEVTVSGPETAMTGASFDVTWTGAVHPRDYVTIVPMGTEDGQYASYFRVGDHQKDSLVAPAEPGLYELRYMLKEGAKVMARAPIEVTEPEVTVSGPDQVRAGDEVLAEWTGAVHPRDYVTIVPMGTPDQDSGDYKRVGDHAKAKLTAPEATGLYELRYVLNEGKRVMARHSLEVLSKDAQLSTGAQLQAPDSATAGATIEVSWSVDGESADQRITLAKGNQPIFTWIVAHKIDGPPPISLTLPEEPGQYELRFLDVAGQKVLSRAPIEVK
ncbi:VWA domain-containing protein [Roseovarius sp. A21]|uniref:VWA domain-containing protein n=1 Tax=Roseovarius bejariae TaxID=2576383 RepID=A0A844D1D0_9RHOB|nr:VWA domain-containing protein [Roseovarius bejariae]MRU16630.1 VWA domain-containing protein [Roseovarius bejariae]